MTGRDGASGAQLEKLRRLIHDRGTLAPVARLVDAHVLSVEPGHVVVRYAVKPDFMHPGRAVQGGIVTAYADMAMAMAAHTLCDEGEFLATSQLSISFLQPVTEGPVLVRDGSGRELARPTSIGAAWKAKRSKIHALRRSPTGFRFQ